MKTLMPCLLLAASLAFGAETGLACTCEPPKGPAEVLGLAAAVFSATVVEMRRRQPGQDIRAGD